MAAAIPGTTTITGAARLRLKESDRLATTAHTLRVLGAQVEEREDGLVIQGRYPSPGAPWTPPGTTGLPWPPPWPPGPVRPR